MSLISVAFYNLENFFDTIDDPNTKDDDFTPKGIMHWGQKRYFNKTKKIAKTISKTGFKETGAPPVLFGISEVENKSVLKDIIKSKALNTVNYDFVHFDSADIRGMDVALLYDKDKFKLIETQKFPIELYDYKGNVYPTRDILYCKGKIFGETLHVFINHWPSRREGELETNQKRRLASQRLREQIDFIVYEEQDPKIIIMGDYNTNPNDNNIDIELASSDLFNPSKRLFNRGYGSINYHKKWMMFDQILLTNNFKNTNSVFKYIDFRLFNPGFLVTWKGKFKKSPFRTFLGKKYQNGYSDHFPVYTIFKIDFI